VAEKQLKTVEVGERERRRKTQSMPQLWRKEGMEKHSHCRI
jgi:hypothetical protein